MRMVIPSSEKNMVKGTGHVLHNSRWCVPLDTTNYASKRLIDQSEERILLIDQSKDDASKICSIKWTVANQNTALDLCILTEIEIA